jgi:hypothetical protein
MKRTKGKIEKRGANRKPAVPPSPLRLGLDAVQEQIRCMAEKLGYDTRQPDWLQLLFEEAQNSPCDRYDDLFTKLPAPRQARSDALRIIACIWRMTCFRGLRNGYKTARPSGPSCCRCSMSRSRRCPATFTSSSSRSGSRKRRREVTSNLARWGGMRGQKGRAREGPPVLFLCWLAARWRA